MATQFLDDLNDAMGSLAGSGLPYDARMERAYALVRDAWMAQGRLDPLIAFIHYNWDSGNGDEFVAPLAALLLERGDASRYARLWKGILRHRLGKLWAYRDPAVTPAQADAIDVAGFDPKDWASYQDRRRATAWHRSYVLAGFDEYIAGLRQLGAVDEIAGALALREAPAGLRRPRARPATDLRTIDPSLFWELIASSRADAGSAPEFLDTLQARLAGFRPAQIVAWARHFEKAMSALNHHDTWALAHVSQGGCGDDGFDDFRAWVVSRGRAVFDAVLAMDVATLRPVLEEEPAMLEGMLYVAGRAYEEAAGEPLPSIRTGPAKPKGKPWREEDLPRRYPALCAAFDRATAA
jgi:hypothetical protein